MICTATHPIEVFAGKYQSFVVTKDGDGNVVRIAEVYGKGKKVLDIGDILTMVRFGGSHQAEIVEFNLENDCRDGEIVLVNVPYFNSGYWTNPRNLFLNS